MKYQLPVSFINRQNVVAGLPDGATVVMVFCEIDCREGLLLAYEKDRYGSVEEGMEVSAAIYVDTLLRLAEQRGFRIFVHPVAPALKETREIVRAFNEILRRQVLETAKAAAKAAASKAGSRPPKAKLTWLEFFDELLTPDGGALRTDFELDGTHLSPAYVPLIGREISKAR